MVRTGFIYSFTHLLIYPLTHLPLREAGIYHIMRTVHLDIGINGAFLTRRWEQPENWMRLTRECGYTAHSFCGDVIDPFFSGDRAFQIEQALATREAAARYG